MKINEILIEQQLDEGPIDFIRKGAAAVGGAFSKNPVQGAKAGWNKTAANIKQQDLINRVTQKAISAWGTMEQNLKTAGTPINQNTVAQWWAKYTNGKTPTSTPTNFSSASMQQWIQKEVANYMATKGQPAAAQPEASADKEQVAPAGAEVETPAQGKVTKRDDGKWYNEQGQQIVDPKDIAELEKRVSALEKGVQPTAPEDETITIGGQKLNPKNPKDAELIKKLQTQMKQQPEGTPPPGGFKATVVDDNGQYVYKRADDNWYREDGTQVQAYDQIEDLEQKFADAKAAAKAKGTAASAPEAQDLPDVSKLTPEERAELRKQLVASMQVTQ